MTVYNAAPWLREAVDSIVAQTYEHWELVVIENGSVDESPAILASYADPRIRVVTVRENIGRTPALVRALELARGELVAVLDADDVSAPTRFAKQVAYLAVNLQVSLVGTWTIRIDGAGREIGRWSPPTDPVAVLDALGYANPIVHSSAMYRAACARNVGGYPTSVPYAQDCALWVRLGARAPIGMIGEFLTRHRSIQGGLTQSADSRIAVARDNLAMLQLAAELLPLSPAAARLNREETTIARLRYAVALAVAGHRLRGGLMVLGTVARDPVGIAWNRVTRGSIGQ
jgi:glycosyltransferase involved in cell wall biosynthesis